MQIGKLPRYSITLELLITIVIHLKDWPQGSGCGSVSRAVASDTRGPRFESSHWQYLY